MTPDFVKKHIKEQCQNYDIIVLKGFSPEIITSLKSDFSLLDDNVISDNKIDLKKINESNLMCAIMNHNGSSKAICTCESFVKLCTMVNNLDIFQKKFCVFENNMMELYPNPSKCDIPDYDSKEFEENNNNTDLYSTFYSFSINDEGKQLVQYIDNYSETNKCVDIIGFIPDNKITIEKLTKKHSDIKLLSTKDGSLSHIMERLYNTMNIDEREFYILPEDFKELSIRIFINAARLFGCPVTLYQLSRNINIEPRKELYSVLKKIWNYDSFRSLKMYKDLSINHDIIEVSQGSIIETIIQQAEHAYNGEKEKIENVLLTSPTGAGKSLLFQLSAIYLAEKYGLLTIIVSPLVALMTDQVEGLTGYDSVATINSNITAAEKQSILDDVRDNKIHLLYLSPELLLSYSIKSFIGERKLGLLVVDEAHTVTTWGRDFRVDYWFLGDYLRKTKRILKYNFPIFALTATAVWDISGKNDMIFDTIRSLNMDPCIKFIGVVRRTNIVFEINQSHINQNYEENRKKLTIRRIKEAIKENRKTIVYFPFKRTVDGIYLSEDISDIKNKVTRYHAQLFSDEKKLNAEAFRSGEKPIMCATKAFGMGIDVSDIKEVYHHAPTGCLSDYVQEIGRLARDPNIKGIAKIDFSTSDFRYIRKLHGLSAIKPYQLMQVLKKLMAIYKINGEKRNMLISADDFDYIFPLSNSEDIDQNLKSCLLLISNDLLNKLRFHSLIVRPKSLFSKCYVEVSKDNIKHFQRLYSSYVNYIKDNIFLLNADLYWTDKYSNISFPMFKQKLATGKIFKDFDIKLKNKIKLSLHDTVEKTKYELDCFFNEAHRFLREMNSTHHRCSVTSIINELPNNYNDLKRRQFVETFSMLYATKYALGGNTESYCRTFQINNETYFQLLGSGYEKIYQIYQSAFTSCIKGQNICDYCDTDDYLVKVCEFLSSLGLADYHRQGGDKPLIFIRINNPYYLNSLIRNKTYKNDILESVYEKYRYSERIFTYFFTKDMTNEQRWDFIEAYFLGASEETLLNFV